MKLSRSYMEFLYSIAAEMFEGREIPNWISQHPAIKDRKIKKVFPSVGLKNFIQPVNASPIDLAPDVNTPFVFRAVYGLSNSSEDAQQLIQEGYLLRHGVVKNTMGSDNTTPEQATELRNKLNEMLERTRSVISVLRAFNTMLTNNEDRLTKPFPDGRIQIISPETIMDGGTGRAVCRPGEPIFRVYGKIKEIVDKTLIELGSRDRMEPLDSISSIKQFNANNIPLTKEKISIVFSSTGEEGAWDIATMSMRGISSCQSWDPKMPSTSNNACIIGSIASNYVGIIYLTSGKDFQGRGASMLKRCVVRFGLDMSVRKEDRKPSIIIDHMYDSYHPGIAKLFLEAVKSRASVPVIDFMQGGSSESDPSTIKLIDPDGLPQVKNKDVDKLTDFAPAGVGYKSYRDVMFPYYDKGEDLEERKLNKEYQSKESEKSLVFNNIRNIDMLIHFLTRRLRIMGTYSTEDLAATDRATNLLAYKLKANKRLMTKDAEFVKKFTLLKLLKLNIQNQSIIDEIKSFVGEKLS